MVSLVHITVADYSLWKSSFDSMSEVRTDGGVVSSKVMQSDTNPNDVFVLLEWSDGAKAKEYFASPDLKASMQEGGVQGTPEIWFGNEA